MQVASRGDESPVHKPLLASGALSTKGPLAKQQNAPGAADTLSHPNADEHHSRKSERARTIPVHADSSTNSASAQQLHARQEHGLIYGDSGGARREEQLIQAVPEVPDRKASMGWSDAKRGLAIKLSPDQAKASPLAGQHDGLGIETGADVVDSAIAADLEALLGQLVNRAGHI